ncbi:hypothetical protein [Bradyrhizobium sp. DOA9]|nr:hypothetical protein [Bradyrhizobium sp. DOA9]GAJ34239.1 hypothetical protein BDOA9_0134370 [Bradyrhizobium sp. DOA9]
MKSTSCTAPKLLLIPRTSGVLPFAFIAPQQGLVALARRPAAKQVGAAS